jgi:hypothetical protein
MKVLFHAKVLPTLYNLLNLAIINRVSLIVRRKQFVAGMRVGPRQVWRCGLARRLHLGPG